MKALKRGLSPRHAGIIFKEMIIDGLPRMSIASAAKALNISRAHLGNVTKGKAAITPKLAVKIGKASNTEPRFWLGMQDNYDLWHAEKSQKTIKGIIQGSLTFTTKYKL